MREPLYLAHPNPGNKRLVFVAGYWTTCCGFAEYMCWNKVDRAKTQVFNERSTAVKYAAKHDLDVFEVPMGD